jgi:hypothetical protein
MKLATIEHQPDFPSVDLSENNALFFELLLTSKAQVAVQHKQAEEFSFLYKISHAAARLNADSIPVGSGFESLEYGMAGYEIIASIITPTQKPVEQLTAHVAARSLHKVMRSSHFPATMHELYAEFAEQQPVAKHVIETAATQHYHYMAHYAVIGAALARQIELDAREYEANQVQE